MNNTNDPKLRSFIPISENSHFPIQNLPYGVFRPRAGGKPRIGTAIGDMILDLSVIEGEGLFDTSDRNIFSQSSLNTFMALGRPAWRKARETISRLLNEDEPSM